MIEFSIVRIANKLVFLPKSIHYKMWRMYLSSISLYQSIFYANLMAFDVINSDKIYYVHLIFILIGIFEISYLIDIIIECFKAYDINGDGVYE